MQKPTSATSSSASPRWRVVDRTDASSVFERLISGSGRTVPNAIAAAASAHPHAAALVELNFGVQEGYAQTWCYEDFVALVRRTGAALREELVNVAEASQKSWFSRCRLVGMSVDEGVQLVVAMLTVLWAGFAFFPLDLANWPTDRCLYTLEVTAACAVLGLEKQIERLGSLLGVGTHQPRILCCLERLVQKGNDKMLGFSTLPDVGPEDLCYAMFTSGTTGRPKCVACPHESALSYALGKAETEGVGVGSRVLLASHFTFDVAQGDVFGTLAAGATLLAGTRAELLADMNGAIFLGQVTHATMTPTQLGLMLSTQMPPGFRNLTLNGEFMREGTAETWVPIVVLRNMYGVTEATGLQTVHTVAIGDSTRLVGRALPGCTIGLLENTSDIDSADDPPSPAAEIIVAGHGLSSGYIGDSDSTARKFIPCSGSLSGRAYLTGDLARWNEHGLELVGRRDHQVKVNGVRVELSEVDGAIMSSGVVAAAVTVLTSGELAVHCLLRESEVFDWVLKAALEASAAAKLPRQVVPHRFYEHNNALPLAAGGKVDRSMLEALSHAESAGDGAEAPFLHLEGGMENAVARCWESALGRPMYSLGASSNFLWLGGASLSALRACRLLRDKLGGENVPPDWQEDQKGEAGLLVSSETPDGAVCALAGVLGPLAPCELIARPVLREYAGFLKQKGLDVLEVAENAIKDSAAKANSAETGGSSAEMALVAAAKDGREAVIRALIAADVSPDGPCRGNPPRGFTPLHAAAASGAVSVIPLLLEARANLRSMTREAQTSPAHLAAARGDAACLALLFDSVQPGGLKPAATWARDVDGQTVLHLAARSGGTECAKTVLNRVRGLRAVEGGLEAKDRFDRSALQWAATNGHEDVARLLLRAGACTNGIPQCLLNSLQTQFAPMVANRKVVQESSKIQGLVDALPHPALPCTDQQRFAMKALRDFCCGARENREAAVDAGAIPRLIALLSTDPGSQPVAAAAQTLRNLAHDKTSVDVMCNADAIPALAAVASLGCNCEAAWRAAAALAQIADWREHWPAIRSSSAPRALTVLNAGQRSGRFSMPKGLLDGFD